jgi:hypothetical protein
MRRVATVGLCVLTAAALAGCSATASRSTAPTRTAAPTQAASPTGAAPTVGPLMGASMGGLDVKHLTSTLAVFPKAEVLRIYEPKAATTIAANPQFAAAVAYAKAHDGEVWYSFKVDPGASWASIVQDWAASGAKIRWTYYHEADDPANHVNPASFVSTFTALIAKATPVSGSRVSEQSIFTAFMLQPSHPHGDPESWYVPAARVIGFDCYNPAALALVIAYAKSKGKPYTIPEMGSGGPRSSTPGDAGALVFARAMVAGWKDSPPLGAAWFSKTGQGGMSTSLSGLPETTAYLNSLIP